MTEIKDELIEALLGCPTVVEFERRDALVRQLPEDIRHNLKITNVPRIDVIQLVDWCMNYQDGLLRLIEQLRFLEGDSLPMARVEEVWLRIHDIPPNISQRSRRTAQETVLQSPETEVRSDKMRQRRVLLLLFVLATSLGVAIWASTQSRRTDSVWTPPPVCQPTGTARIGLAPLDGCAPSVRAQLMNELQADGDKVSVVLLDASATSPPSTNTGPNLDLVVTGSCLQGEANRVTLTFSVAAKQIPDELYTPPRIVLTDTVEMAAHLGRAMSSYQRGDPDSAIEQFRLSPIDAPTREQSLLTANSLLLAGRYDEAIAAYENMVIDPGTMGWSAVHNNLGVARLNQWSLKPEGVLQAGLTDFDRAIALARQGAERQIEAIAHVNKGWFQDRAGNWSEADASCQAALSLNTQSPLPYLCRIRHILLYNASVNTADKLSTGDIEQWLKQIEQLDASFPWLHYFRGVMNMRTDERQAAIADFERFYQAMHHRACLRTDQDAIEIVRGYIDRLTR